MYPVVFGPVCTGQGIRMQRLSVALLEGRYVQVSLSGRQTDSHGL
jgi:hypothetical protein